jgi:hypothetical protein
MSRIVRIVLGLALGALLGTFPFLHYRWGAGHGGSPELTDRLGDSHAHHTH